MFLREERLAVTVIFRGQTILYCFKEGRLTWQYVLKTHSCIVFFFASSCFLINLNTYHDLFSLPSAQIAIFENDLDLWL